MQGMSRFFISHITNADLTSLQTIGALHQVIEVGMECFLREHTIGT